MVFVLLIYSRAYWLLVKFRNFAVVVPVLSGGDLCDLDGKSGKFYVRLSTPGRVFEILIYKPQFS